MESVRSNQMLELLRSRLGSILQREGVPGLAKRLVPHLLSRPLHRKGYVIACPLDQKVIVPESAVEIEIHEVTLAETALLDELAEMNEFHNTRAELVERLNNDELCYAALHGGRIVSYSWMSFREYAVTYLNRTFPLASDEVYYYDAYTLAEYRGMGVNPCLNAVSARRIAAKYGKRTLVGFMRVRNQAAMRSMRRRGVFRISTAGYIKLFGFRFHYFFKDRVL